eukprot:m.163067 g.163067  ORF g.163067 m.163067 type:complete len:380 (+) comp21023_c0_seq3:3-1142(+)
MLVLLAVLGTVASACAACSTDVDCALNGVCAADKECACFVPWQGPNCTRLHLLPAAPTLPYQDLTSTTWGATATFDPESQLYHLFTAEMVNHCGLLAWETNSQIIHATSPHATGPFERRDVSIGVFSHNPYALRTPAGTWLLFHIGTGEEQRPPCSASGCSNGTTHKCETSAHAKLLQNTTAPLLHTAPRPEGPWTPVPLKTSDNSNLTCNNPGPLLLKNGSMVLVCSGKSPDHPFLVYMAPSWHGPYTLLPFAPHNFDTTMHNEDWFLFQDPRGNFHVLTHWQFGHADGPCPGSNGFCGGHFFSTDLINWHWAWQAAYNGDVLFTNGSTIFFTCRQRPHFVYDPSGAVPVALLNGASHFARHPGGDYSFTLGQPIAQQ